MPSLIGQTLLDQYHVDAFSAQTPLGETYRVTATRRNKPFLLTVLPEAITEDAEALKQLEADSSKLRAISHPNLVPYLGFFQTAKLAFLLEEWIDGPALRDVLAHAPVTVNEALVYVKAICGALDAIHKQGYLHLSLAPEMIHINKRGEIFLSGLGGARPLRTKGFLRAGKVPPHYAAPEQFTHEPLAFAADTYALAVLLYELITGAWINGKSAPKTMETIRRHHLETIPPAPISLNPELPDNFSRMTLWALRKKPSDRLKTTTELLSSLTLAAGINADEVPLRADDPSAPVTSSILKDWEYLPPAKPNLIEDDRPPLDQRFAEATPGSAKKFKSNPRLLPILGFTILVGFISLFFFIKPAPIPIAPTPFYLTPFIAAKFTPPPSLTPTPKPTHAPGNRIAFTCTRGDYNQICLINVDGSGFAQLSNLEASNYYPVFYPKGGSLLFSSNRNSAFDLYLLSFDERQLFQITNNIGNVVSPDFSPDGSRIVFVNRAADSSSSIWIVNADGLNPRLVYKGLNTIVATAWSPDGGMIAYAMSRGIPNEFEIFVMGVDGANNHQITHNMLGIGGSVSWSPDSKYLLVFAGPVGDKNIFRIDAAAGDYTQLTNGGNNASAAYSPDGQWIAYNSLRNKDQADIYIMRADGSEERRLTNDPQPDWGPRWEP